MRIGMIGAGFVSQNVAKLAVAQGHDHGLGDHDDS